MHYTSLPILVCYDLFIPEDPFVHFEKNNFDILFVEEYFTSFIFLISKTNFDAEHLS